VEQPMKKFLKVFVALAVDVDDVDNVSLDAVEPRGNASTTVSGSKGNRYSVSGTSIMYLKGGKILTSFSTSYYFDGTTSSVNGYIKNISVSGGLSLSGGGYYGFDKKSDAFSGASGSVSVEKTGLLYTVISVAGVHTISTNTESETLYSYQY